MQFKVSDPGHHFARDFRDFTIRRICAGDLVRVRMCFNLIEKLLQNGKPEIREAILSVYMPSLFNTINRCPLKSPLIHLLPALLKKEYERLDPRNKNFKSDLTEFVLHLN